MKEIKVYARPWDKGWELHIDDEHVTQVELLNDAVQQVKDYLQTVSPETNYDDLKIVIKINPKVSPTE